MIGQTAYSMEAVNMKNISNILLLIISLLFIVAGMMLIPQAAIMQNLAFVIMTLLIVGIFGIIRYIAHRIA